MKMKLNILFIVMCLGATKAWADDVFNATPPPAPVQKSSVGVPSVTLKSPQDYANTMHSNEATQNEAFKKQQAEDAKRNKEKAAELMAEAYQDNLGKTSQAAPVAPPAEPSPPLPQEPATSEESVSNFQTESPPAPEEKPAEKKPASEGWGITY